MADYVFSIIGNFPNDVVATDRLTLEIQQSTIVTALDRIDTAGDVLTVVFKATLSGGDQTTLNGIVAVHSGEPLASTTNVTLLPVVPTIINAYTTTSGSAFTAFRATTFAEMATPQKRSVKSANASDFLSGTGAQKVTIKYYTDTLAGPYTETLFLSGTTAVPTSASNICYVESMNVASVGSQLGNVGAISLFSSSVGTGTTMAQIAASDNQTYYCHHYVAPGFTVKISDTSCFINGTNGGVLTLREVNPLLTSDPEQTIGIPLHVEPGAASTQNISNTPVSVVGPARILAYLKADGTPGFMNWTGAIAIYEVTT